LSVSNIWTAMYVVYNLLNPYNALTHSACRIDNNRVVYKNTIFNNWRIRQHTKMFYTSFNSVYWALSKHSS